jgi:Protein of unknown function (DUF3455)
MTCRRSGDPCGCAIRRGIDLGASGPTRAGIFYYEMRAVTLMTGAPLRMHRSETAVLNWSLELPISKLMVSGVRVLSLPLVLSFACLSPAVAASDSADAASQRPAPAAPTDVPAALQAPHREQLVMKALGVGVQIYTCGPSKEDPQQFIWNLTAPEASLFDAGGRHLGKHYAGPSWEANDGSKITGVVKAHVDSPVKSAIPWLLLTTRSTATSGTFAKVRSVQRLHTVAGIAPTMQCDASVAGRTARVPYTADYYFYEAVR